MSKFYDALNNIEQGRKACVKNLNEQGITTPEDASISQIASNIQLGVNGVDMWNTNYQLTNTEWRAAVKIIPQLNTSRITSMYSMFSGCESLISVPQLDTSQVTDMGRIFSNCKSLTTIPQLNTSKVNNMSSMFNTCESLISVPQLDTSQVTDMDGMFSSCNSLTTIPQLDISKVTDMGYMFFYSTALKEINLSSAPILPNCDMSSTFDGIPADCLIKVYDEASKQKVLESRSDLTNVVVTGGK